MTETTAKVPQRVFVFRHMQTHGYITDVVARNYGVRRLAGRIEELKRNGVGIDVELRRDDKGSRYAYYTLTTPTCKSCVEAALKTPERIKSAA